VLYFRGSRVLRRVILPLTLLAFMSACHKWVPLEPPVAQAITEEEPGTVRVTLADNSRVVLKEPRVSGDSLIGLDDTVGVPLEEVQQVEAQRANTLATIGLVVGSVLLVYAGFAVYCSATDECDFGGD